MIGLVQSKTIDHLLWNACLIFLACYVFIAAVPFYSFASSQSDAIPATEEELYQLCRSVYAKGKFVDAGQHIEKFLSLYPKSDHAGEILFMRAFLQFAIDAAAKVYGLIIEKYPNTDWAAKSHFQLGQSCYLQGKYDEALDHYGKIIISHSESEAYWPALYWKCKSLIAKGDYEKAVPVLRSLKGSDSAEINRDMILMSLGACYRGMKDHENAEASYRALIDSTPDSQWISSAYLLLGRSLQDRGKLEEAKNLYQRVIKDYGRSIETHRAQEYLNSLSLSLPESVEAQPAASESAETTHTPSTPAVSHFAMQVGAFSNERNADSLENRLKKKGYSVSIVRPVPDKSRLYKVRVGKFKTRSAALKAARTFSKNEKMTTEIVIWQSTTSD